MRLRAAISLVAFAACASACAQPGYDARALERQLVDAGATPDEADCVTDGLGDLYDVNQLASRTEPTETELATTRQLLVDCGVIDEPPQP